MEKINYEKMLVTYIDILGFQDIINRENGSPAKVNTVLDIFSQNQHLSGWHPKAEYNSFVFSDSMVRLVKVKNEKDILNKLFGEIKHLAFIQLTSFSSNALVGHHFLLRGAITYGDIFYDARSNRLFGPAFNKAVKLESSKAKYPRIIIDNDNEFFSPAVAKSSAYCISVDSEKIAYIDYLQKAIKGDAFKSHKRLIKKHGTIIKDKILELEKEIEKNMPALHKYYWLKKYHNDTLTKELKTSLHSEFMI